MKSVKIIIIALVLGLASVANAGSAKAVTGSDCCVAGASCCTGEECCDN